MRRSIVPSFLFLAALLLAPASAADRLPNIVFILTDNQGAWTLGCYGNPDIRTPHIDRMAAEGMLFTRALASNPVCSPTRATFLTGLMPSQHGVHSFLSAGHPQIGPDAYYTLAEFVTLPRVLKEAGYTTGLVGKWHLGANETPQDGFSYWITTPHGGTREFYDQEVIENGTTRIEPKYLTDLWTEHGVKFIEQNKEQPFFLYLSYNGPYNLGASMSNPPRNRHADSYSGHHFKSFPVDNMHPWQHANKQFHNTQNAMERVAAETSAVDDGVGEIMAALRRHGLDENTLVIYAADQGWMGGQNGLWGMGDHTRPASAFELMMQIPFIFRHPGKIPAGGQSDIVVSNYDFMPSVLGYLGLDRQMPDQPRSPGRDFSAFLRGGGTSWENVMYYEMEYTRAIREERWKYVGRINGPFELYDLETDPFERFNLFGQPGLEELTKRLSGRVDRFFSTYADPKYDLWKDGGSKARIHSQR